MKVNIILMNLFAFDRYDREKFYDIHTYVLIIITSIYHSLYLMLWLNCKDTNYLKYFLNVYILKGATGPPKSR